MEIQEYTIRRAVCQIDYDAWLTFYSEQGRIAMDLLRQFGMRGFGHTEDEFTLQNKETEQWVFVGPKRIRTIANRPEDFKKFLEFTEAVFHICWKRLSTTTDKEELKDEKTKTIARMGLRLMYLAEVDAENYDELNAVLTEQLLNGGFWGKSRFGDGRISDTGLILDFHRGVQKGHVEIGPLVREEVLKKLEQVDLEHCPEMSFLVDCDYAVVRVKDKPIQRLRDFLKEGHEHIQEFADGVFSQLKGE